MTRPRSGGLLGWLKVANPVVMSLNRLGLAVGTQHILVIPGRTTGTLRSTPVAVVCVNGSRYVVSALESDWAKNARVAGWGLLSQGRRTERVTLAELPVEDRAPILREFPRQVRGGVRFFEGVLGKAVDQDVLVGAAPRVPVFRIESAAPR